ncbi:MAG: TolC family protein [Gammaproteobacteria bacterium]|nr:TolC family protein [Gammaproteobacteria bacterium]
MKLLVSRYAFFLVLLYPWSSASWGQTVTVGLVTDGPEARPGIGVPVSVLAQEIESLIGNERTVVFPADKRLDGGWALEGVRDSLRRLLADPEVDIVMAMGVVSSNEAARMNLQKPLIAAMTGDARLQAFPISAQTGGSGKANFVYVSSFRTIDQQLETFRDATGYEHLAALVDQLTLDSIPALAQEKASELEALLGIRISVVPVTDSIDAALARLPADIDAVYVTPLLRIDDAAMVRLADGLIERGLPSFSLLGRGELEYGLLMATGGREEDQVRYLRRLALNLQRILRGEQAEEIPVSFRESQRLTVNMRTAAAIGYVPRYAVTADAELLYLEELEQGEPLTLAEAMLEALEANLSLAVAEIDPLVARETVRLARAALRPQLGVGLQGTAIDQDRGNPFFQAERSTEVQVSGSQVIYSDDDRSRIVVAERQALAADHAYRIVALDTAQVAAQAYLTVLRARALEAVRRSNLEVTRANLELASIRESIGISGRGDVLRWESQLATDLRRLIAAEADRRAALTDLNRVLNRPQTNSFSTPSQDIASVMALFDNERFRVFIEDPAAWETLQSYFVERALQDSPELMVLDETVIGQERQVLSSRRKYYVPEVALSGTRGSILNRSGVGSDLTGLGLDDLTWTVALTANWPLLTSGALRARLNGNRYVLRRLQRQRLELEQQIEARMRVALLRTASTQPAVELSQDAARAAQENLTLITDAYSEGAVSVTDLINAQDAALAAELQAADAQYAFLADAVNVFRSSADFSVLLEPENIEAWYRELEDYFSASR